MAASVPRTRERTRPEREKYYKSLSLEERSRVSDLEEYPTKVMTFGKGFSNGLAKVTVNGKSGFINSNGKIVISPKFKDAGQFSEGLAPFENENGKWGFIDTKGKIVIPPTYDWALSFAENRSLVQIGDKWGYINTTGSIVINPQFDHANSFSEGLAHVQVYMENNAYPDKRKTYKSGYIDKNGKWIIEPSWDGGDDFRDGRAKVGKNTIENGRYMHSEGFFINKAGTVAFRQDVAGGYSHFTEGLYIKEDGGLYEIIDVMGNDATEEIYDDLNPFSEGMAYFENDGKQGFIDKAGNIVFEVAGDVRGGFSDGLVAFVDSKHRFGYLNKSGTVQIEPKFEWGSKFNEGFALVIENRKMGYINKMGKFIWKPTK